jgi:hypothetical protein
LRGKNQAYIDRHLPHLAALLVESPRELFAHASVVVLGSDLANDVDHEDYPGRIVDLRVDLGRPAQERPEIAFHPVESTLAHINS